MTIVDENTFVLGLWEQPGVLYETEQRFHANATAIKLNIKTPPPMIYYRSCVYHFYKGEKNSKGDIKKLLYRVGNFELWFVVWNR